jgi:sugar phosphate isomerase/epimerase
MFIGFIFRYPDSGALDKVDLLKDMGVDALEVQTPEVNADVRAFVAQCKERGLAVGSLSPRWGWLDRALKDPGELRVLRSFIRASGELGLGRILLSCSGVQPSSAQAMQAHKDQVAEIYRDMSKDAEAAGVDLCTHTATRPGTAFDTEAGIESFLENVGSRRNRLLFCAGCLSVGDWDVPALARRWREALGAVHIYNHQGDWSGHQEVLFDRGELRVGAVLRALKDVGYQGAVIPEHYPALAGASGKEMSDSWVVGYLRGMLQALE